MKFEIGLVARAHAHAEGDNGRGGKVGPTGPPGKDGNTGPIGPTGVYQYPLAYVRLCEELQPKQQVQRVAKVPSGHFRSASCRQGVCRPHAMLRMQLALVMNQASLALASITAEKKV